jgi:nucleoside-diphosphate-sugar epimerase
VVAVKALVVGASGFVGRRLCPGPAQTGHDVAAMTRNPAAYAATGTPVQADVQYPGTLGAAMAGWQLARAGDRPVLTCGGSPCAWRSSCSCGTSEPLSGPAGRRMGRRRTRRLQA